MFAARKIFPIVCALLLAATAGPTFAQATTTPVPPATGAAAPAVEKTVELNRAAKVVLVQGDVAAYSPTRQKRVLSVGDTISEGDSIVTGKDGELHLDLEDGGYMSVRPNTRMRIAKYQAKGEDSDRAVFSLLEGSLRSVTGWIGKFNRNHYVVRTPNATVGIRGTDHEPFVILKGSSVGEPGTYDKVNEGGSFIQTPAGRADVAPNQAGFVPQEKGAKPRLLKEIPKHFRPGRFDQRFEGKHAEVRARIDKRREDRRTEIRQKLQGAKAATPDRRAQKQQAQKEKREAALKQREDAKKTRVAAKKEKEAKRKEAEDEAAAEKAERAERAEKPEKAEKSAKVPHRANAAHK